MFTLRKYQQEAVNAVLDSIDAGARNILLVLPTGTGKTVIFSELARIMADKGKKTLVIAHRDELITQAKEKLQGAGCATTVEKAEQEADLLYSTVVVSSVQTMSRRKEKFGPDCFSLLVIDEAHHALAKSYMELLNYFNCPVLGVTATPDRGDKKNLGKIFEAVAYEYTLVEAVREGYLCNIIVSQIPVSIDVSNVNTMAGDLSEDECGEAVSNVLTAIADALVPYLVEEKKTLIFTPLVKNAEELAVLLTERGILASWVSGNHPDREKLVLDFRNSNINVLVNAMLLTEGFDCPDISCIVPLRPTRSRALYAQMVGRGTRIAEGKERLHIIDPLWIAGKHNLCNPTCLVAKNEEMERRMRARFSTKGFDLFSTARAVENELITEAAENAKRKLAELVKTGKKRVFSPLDVALYTERMDVLTYEPALPWESLPPTDKQKALLNKFGVDPDSVETRGHASRILSVMFDRIKKGKPTIKQIEFLRRLNLPVPATKEEASQLITRRIGNAGIHRN